MNFTWIVVVASCFFQLCVLDEPSKKHKQVKFMRPCFMEDEALQTCALPGGPCHQAMGDDLKLVKLEGVRTGHVRWVELEEGNKYKLITRAVKPLILEIPHFLTDEECENIISLAKASGLSTSVAGHQSYEGDLDELLNAAGNLIVELIQDSNWTLGHEDAFAQDPTKWDSNKDGIIDIHEVKSFATEYRRLFLKNDEVHEMLRRSGIIEDFADGKTTTNVFRQLNIKKILTYMEFLKTKSPRHRSRFSQQAWLRQDKTAEPILRRLHERIIRLTKLPRKIIQGGEAMQVVRYEKFGHYHVHLDSGVERLDLPCCHQNHFRAHLCKLCRFITILYYLNDVEEGGETAFPLADNATLSEKELSKGSKFETNLSAYCHSSNLVVSPKKGTAILWYNNLIDPDSGLLGPLDLHSLHGGCDVIKGEKWISNNWLTAPTKYSRHIKSIYDTGFD